MAARATPTRADVNPASQAPTLNRPQPAAATGPTRAPACCAEPTISSSRRGMNASKVIMPIDQNTSAATIPMSTLLRPSRTSPLLITAGVWRASVRACVRRVRSEPTSGRCSRMATVATTRCTTLSTTDTQTAASSADASSWPKTVAAGFHQMSPPESTAPTAIATPRMDPARESWRSTSAPGVLSCTVSTNQASSGPESSARNAPIRAPATTNAQKLCAIAYAVTATTLTTAAAR